MLKIAVPTLKDMPWNDETLGDDAEGLLATGLRKEAYHLSQAVALWLEMGAGLMYSVISYFPHCDTVEKVIDLVNICTKMGK